MFYNGLYKENMKKSSCPKPQGLDIWYVALSSGLNQVCPNCAPGAKNGPALFIGIYMKTFCLKPQGLDP